MSASRCPYCGNPFYADGEECELVGKAHQNLAQSLEDRFRTAAARYDMPRVTTTQLLSAIKNIIGLIDDCPGPQVSIHNLLDVIRQMIPEPTVQDVRVGAYLIGQDYEPARIKTICASLRHGSTLEGCTPYPLKSEDVAPLDKLLEKS